MVKCRDVEGWMLLLSAANNRTARHIGLVELAVDPRLRGRRSEIMPAQHVPHTLHPCCAECAWCHTQRGEPLGSRVICWIFTASTAYPGHVETDALRGLQDAGPGNYVKPCLDLPQESVGADQPLHAPREGASCGAAGRDSCVPPWACELRRLGWLLLQCPARGDFAIGCMGKWEGLPREPASGNGCGWSWLPRPASRRAASYGWPPAARRSSRPNVAKPAAVAALAAGRGSSVVCATAPHGEERAEQTT